MDQPSAISVIAKRVGVSEMTVYRALNGGEYRRPTFRKRADKIRQMAEELGHRPNASARATREGRFRTITLLMSADPGRSELPKHMFYGIQAAASQHDLAVNLNIIPDEQLTDPSFVPKALRELHSDGLLINYHKHPPARLQEIIERHDIPSVFLNLDADHDSARPDDFGAGQAATQQLIELGHRRIWYVGYSFKRENFHYSEIDRRDGYIRTMIDAGLEPTAIDRYNAVFGQRSTDEIRTEPWERLFCTDKAPTAVLCYGEIGFSTVHITATRAGLRVPDDLSLATFSGTPRFSGLPMTTWLSPEYEVGRVGLDMLYRKIEQPQELQPAAKVPFTLSPGGKSVAAPNSVSQ